MLCVSSIPLASLGPNASANTAYVPPNVCLGVCRAWSPWLEARRAATLESGSWGMRPDWRPFLDQPQGNLPRRYANRFSPLNGGKSAARRSTANQEGSNQVTSYSWRARIPKAGSTALGSPWRGGCMGRSTGGGASPTRVPAQVCRWAWRKRTHRFGETQREDSPGRQEGHGQAKLRDDTDRRKRERERERQKDKIYRKKKEKTK